LVVSLFVFVVTMDSFDGRRRRNLKKVVDDPEEARRKREDNIIEMRK